MDYQTRGHSLNPGLDVPAGTRGFVDLVPLAHRSYRTLDLEAALKWTSAILAEAKPGNESRTEAYEIQGRIAYLEGRCSEAIAFFTQALDNGGNPPGLRKRIADAMVRCGDFRGACASYGGTAPAELIALADAGGPRFEGARTKSTIALTQIDPIPCMRAVVQGLDGCFILDTGAPGLCLTEECARKIGLEILREKRGNYSGVDDRRVGLAVVSEFILGDFTMRAVPVSVLFDWHSDPELWPHGPILGILGIGVLDHFLTTLDYDAGTMSLTRRDVHRSAYDGGADATSLPAKVPFLRAGTHYLLSRGSIEGRTLTLFVDSGLVALHQESDESPLRQAAFMAPRSFLADLGVPAEHSPPDDPFFFPIAELCLGPLKQTELLGFCDRSGASPLVVDTIPVGGIISHAFLRQYVWTIDFDRQEFVLANRSGGRKS